MKTKHTFLSVFTCLLVFGTVCRADLTWADNVVINGNLTVTGSGAIRSFAPLAAPATIGVTASLIPSGAQAVFNWNPSTASLLVGVGGNRLGVSGNRNIVIGLLNDVDAASVVVLGDLNHVSYSTNSFVVLRSMANDTYNSFVAAVSHTELATYSVAIANASVYEAKNSAAFCNSGVSGADASFAAGNSSVSVERESGSSFNIAMGNSRIDNMGTSNTISMNVALAGSEIAPWDDSGNVASFAACRAQVYGSRSFAVCEATTNGGNYSFAACGGYIEGNYSLAIGKGTKSIPSGTVVLGCYNKMADYVKVDEWVPSSYWFGGDPLFMVGNGQSEDARSNAFLVLKNGKVCVENKYWDPAEPTFAPSQPKNVTIVHSSYWDDDIEDWVVDQETGDVDEASGGVALEVGGHTVLKGNTRLDGKVTMSQPQGDILMGVFGMPQATQP